MQTSRLLSSVFAAMSITACGSATTTVIPNSGTLLPNATINVWPNVAYSFEQIAVAAAAGGLLYVIYDPLAPNWSIQEQVLSEDTFHLALSAKSFRTGGDGEAIQIVKRRARQLQRLKGYADYRILDYTEGIESSTPLTHRVSEGTIQLVKTLIPEGR